jgi:DNA-binding NarL/FixJ family response regulator
MKQQHENSTSRKRQVAMLIAVTSLQILGAAFFITDSFEDQTPNGLSKDLVVEGAIALALLIGVCISGGVIFRLVQELRQNQNALARFKGALSDHILTLFEQWKLTKSERDVALFAIKGFDISEIAALRGAANGTIRAQLSQIYTKAEVTSQAMLVSLLLDDLIDLPSNSP